MILYIAEKPSLARALADALPKPHKRQEGYIQLGNGDAVSWCIGHLLEQAEPEAYNADYKKWRIEHLPIVPDQWQLKPKPKTKAQLAVLKKLIKQADQLVNVGDPDREGQLLVDEVIQYCRAAPAKISQAQRCLISDLNTSAIKRALTQLRANREFIPLSTSALARSRADWLYGINMTRLCTLIGQKSGYKGVLSIGRVQTPILGLIVKRDDEIEHFVSKPFYELEVTLSTPEQATFKAKWRPSEACQPYMDDENRLLSRPLAENVAARVLNQTGKISRYEQKNKKQTAPLPYNLSALQIDAAKCFGLSAKQTLDVCQQLYERHTLITYPRSDCRYLPMTHLKEANQVLASIASNDSILSDIIKSANSSQRSSAWNDKKVSAHHAIIPTSKKTNIDCLNKDEQRVYQLIARQYIMQFMPAFEYLDTLIEATILTGLFVAKTNQKQNEGWKAALYLKPKPSDDFVELPKLTVGTAVTCTDTHISDKQTTPPRRFTDASLMAAMTGIARFVTDPDIRKILRETDGLGTEATRASIVELLFTRDFLTRKGKEIRATVTGSTLIHNLPATVAQPDMTAQWEAQLNEISQKTLDYKQFMSPMLSTLDELIDHVGTLRFDGLNGLGKAAFKKKTGKKFSKKRTKKPVVS
ncbi:DNA topoisomerase III [bacterium]|nr:DNA topoisomerase III [bacterium]